MVFMLPKIGRIYNVLIIGNIELFKDFFIFLCKSFLNRYVYRFCLFRWKTVLLAKCFFRIIRYTYNSLHIRHNIPIKISSCAKLFLAEKLRIKLVLYIQYCTHRRNTRISVCRCTKRAKQYIYLISL